MFKSSHSFECMAKISMVGHFFRLYENNQLIDLSVGQTLRFQLSIVRFQCIDYRFFV